MADESPEDVIHRQGVRIGELGAKMLVLRERISELEESCRRHVERIERSRQRETDLMVQLAGKPDCNTCSLLAPYPGGSKKAAEMADAIREMTVEGGPGFTDEDFGPFMAAALDEAYAAGYKDAEPPSGQGRNLHEEPDND